jgi:hypothetical protein
MIVFGFWAPGRKDLLSRFKKILLLIIYRMFSNYNYLQMNSVYKYIKNAKLGKSSWIGFGVNANEALSPTRWQYQYQV